jgi:CRISPR-associated protein Cas1
MAASHTLPHEDSSRKSPLSRNGVLTLSGYGIKVRMQAGHLEMEDGVGPDRRRIRLARVGHGLKRLVCISESGFVTLDALKFLSDVGASFAMLNRNGKVLFVAGPTAPSDARLRRTQALAHTSDLALKISQELISRKLAGQEKVARLHLLDDRTADRIVCYREELAGSTSLRNVSIIEAHAAGHYWAAYQNLPVNFPKKDDSRIPEHWKTFGNRASPLTGSPRRAANPANAILNYAYSLLEAESRLAAAALGLDVGLAFLHHDAPNRDSLACDLMEAVRPQVDAWLVAWITKETLKRQWFFEQRDGGCRLMADLAERISETAPTWGRAVAPIAEWVVHMLWSDQRRTPSERAPATRLTQRRRSEGRGNEYVSKMESAPRPTNVCPGCGVTTKRGRRCPNCGREVSRQKLIELARVGRVVGHSAQSRKKQAQTMRRHKKAQKRWLSMPQSEWPTEEVYFKEIQPRLSAITISKIAAAIGVTEPYAAQIRSGKHRPHPRHWEAIGRLVGISPGTI